MPSFAGAKRASGASERGRVAVVHPGSLGRRSADARISIKAAHSRVPERPYGRGATHSLRLANPALPTPEILLHPTGTTAAPHPKAPDRQFSRR
jgi:hypothetical protein